MQTLTRSLTVLLAAASLGAGLQACGSRSAPVGPDGAIAVDAADAAEGTEPSDVAPDSGDTVLPDPEDTSTPDAKTSEGTDADPTTDLPGTVVDTVQITVGTPLQCVPAAPSGVFSPASITVQAGSATPMQMILDNHDVDCALGVFLGTYSVPEGWENAELNGFDTSMSSGGQKIFDMMVPVPAEAEPGEYTITATATQVISGLETAYSLTVIAE
jgi:hypothetical protein